MANAAGALAPRVDGQIPLGGAREQLAHALQLNRYIGLDPTVERERYEWEQTAWNVAEFVFLYLLKGFTIGGLTAISLLIPELTPVAVIVAVIGFLALENLSKVATAKASASGWQAFIERGVAAQLENLPAGPNDIVHAEIDRAVPQDHRFIAARYLYWKNQVAQLEGVVRDGLQIVNPAPDVLALLPQDPRERREQIEAARLAAFRIETEQVLPAKVQAAYWYGILRRPDFRMEFEQQVSFDLPPFSADNEERTRRAQARLANIGLSHNFNVVPDAPFATIARGMWQGQEARVELTLAQVRQLTEAQLSTIVVPPA